MTFPRHYPQTYGTRTVKTTTKIIESLSSVMVSTPRAIERLCEGVIQIVGSISSTIIRLVLATISATPTRVSGISKSVSALCTAISGFVGVRLYSKLVSATSSVVGVVDQYTVAWKKLIAGVIDSSVFRVWRGASKHINCVSDTVSSIQRSISKTSIGYLISVGTVSRNSGRFIQQTTDILGAISKKVTKVTITKAVVGYVGVSGTILKTTIIGFVKKMFTYPADPEFKVEEDE
jgi:hypothetical protein